jgi:hypothetical protein
LSAAAHSSAPNPRVAVFVVIFAIVKIKSFKEIVQDLNNVGRQVTHTGLFLGLTLGGLAPFKPLANFGRKEFPESPHLMGRHLLPFDSFTDPV